MSSLADRAWFAYHCLPRTRRGKPPSYRSLEGEAGLGSGTMSRLMLGEREEHSYETKAAFARMLHVSLEWLAEGRGEAPTPTGPVPPRLPYLNTQNETTGELAPPDGVRDALDAARAFILQAALEAPDAGHMELLARAQVLAAKAQR